MEDFKIDPNRRTFRTTLRIVTGIVDLLQNGEVTINDHYEHDNDHSYRINFFNLFDRIMEATIPKYKHCFYVKKINNYSFKVTKKQ